MAFDYVLLGKKLLEARKSLLIDPPEAAARLQISVKDYLDLELGKKKATGDQVVLLAALYERDFRYFVTGDYPSAESQIKEMFRLNASLSKQDRIAIQKFVRLCEYEGFLEQEVFNKKYEPIPDYRQRRFIHSNFTMQGVEAAKLERNRLHLELLPIRNIFDLIRNQGIHVFKRQLEDRNISGLYIRHPTVGHCILINYLDDIYRQNFSAAHEYCHALFDSIQGQEVTYVNRDDQEIEQRANSFARNFMAPFDNIKKYYKPATGYDEWIGTIRSIAQNLGVSSKVIIIQLLKMKWISEELKEQLWSEKQLVIKSEEKFDPEIPIDLSLGSKNRLTKIIRHGLSWHFIDLCTEAYRQNKITYRKILEMLFLPWEEGHQLLNELLTFLKVSEP